jgi:hypothetical protein
MAAPEGNQFWRKRLKHGRNHKIETEQEIEENFEEYCQWADENPLNEIDFRGKDANKVTIPKMRAMTKDHFALCCGLSGWEKLETYKERSEGFREVITRIEKLIYYQKFTGTAAGFLNPNIIAADLDLKSKQEIDLTTKGKPFTLNIKPDSE